jgi:transcriptional regulator with GAF, ATPase, and Fis domain
MDVTAGVWLASLLSDGPKLAAEVAAGLAAAGLAVAPVAVARGLVAGPGIVLFDQLTAEVAAAITSFSRRGQVRVLAMAAAPAALGAHDMWRLLERGAADVLVWDDRSAAGAAAARVRRWAEVDRLVDSPAVRDRLVGRSAAWRSVLRQIVEVARFTDASVLLTGESGTGKELVARLIHELDPRPDKGALVVVDCTTVVPTLSGSEFFGHERGAFTGAVSARDGAFALADQGTLFLDEVGELPPPLQAELLRVVQEGMYKRVGSNVWQSTRFRLVCASNRDLVVEQAGGGFRSDLYYRIAAATIRLPPLRDRAEDMLPLFDHFLAELAADGQAPALEEFVREVLLRRDYPGNVRDLRQLAVRVSNRHVGPGPATVGDLPEEEWPLLDQAAGPGPGRAPDWDTAARLALAGGASLRELRDAAADAAVRVAIEEADGNLRQAAGRLGVTDRALQLRRAAARQDGQGRPVARDG